MTRTGTLFVFDIDDTLFRTTARMRVLNAEGEVVARLDNEQLKHYELPPGHCFDVIEFTDARLFYEESVPIDSIAASFKRIVEKVALNLYHDSQVIILTARSQLDDVVLFREAFKKNGMNIDHLNVHCTGDPPGENQEPPSHIRKQIVVRDYLLNNAFTAVYMFDDSFSNLGAFLALQAEFPETKFDAYVARPDGLIAQLNHKR